MKLSTAFEYRPKVDFTETNTHNDHKLRPFESTCRTNLLKCLQGPHRWLQCNQFRNFKSVAGVAWQIELYLCEFTMSSRLSEEREIQDNSHIDYNGRESSMGQKENGRNIFVPRND